MFGSLLCRNTTHCFAIPGAFYVDNLYIVSNIQADSIQHITKSIAEFLNVWFTPLSQYNPLFCDSRCVHVDNLYIVSNIQADKYTIHYKIDRRVSKCLVHSFVAIQPTVLRFQVRSCR